VKLISQISVNQNIILNHRADLEIVKKKMKSGSLEGFTTFFTLSPVSPTVTSSEKCPCSTFRTHEFTDMCLDKLFTVLMIKDLFDGRGLEVSVSHYNPTKYPLTLKPFVFYRILLLVILF